MCKSFFLLVYSFHEVQVSFMIDMILYGKGFASVQLD